MTDFINYRQKDDVAILTMNDGKANAWGPAMMAAMAAALDQAEAEARAVIITGRPGMFCAGFDMKIMARDVQARDALVTEGLRLLERLYLHPQPVIVALSGHAVAAGALLALAGDTRLCAAEDSIKIGLNEVAIGFVLPTLGRLMARDRLSPQNVTDAVLKARIYNPAEACKAGFVDHLVAPETLLDQALEAATTLLALDSKAFAVSKDVLRRDTVAQSRAASDSVS